MRIAFASCLLAMTLAANNFAQEIPADLKSAIRARNEALRSGDDQTWGRYTTDDFIAIDSTGTATKAQRMSQIRAKTNTAFPAGSESDVKHLIHGDTVIRTFLVGNIRQTAIWVKQKDQWRVALAQQTLLKKSQ